jgi:hypothetical protein
MIQSGPAFTNRTLHKSGQRRQYIDRGVDLLVMELSLEVYLTLCDIPGQIRDRMSDVIIRHGQNRKLRDRPVLPIYSTSPLVNRTQIGVHVPWVGSTTRDLLSGRGDLFERVCVL